MPVWVVVTHQGYGESTEVDSVFSSEELARAYLATGGFELLEDHADTWCRETLVPEFAGFPESSRQTYATIEAHEVDGVAPVFQTAADATEPPS